MAELIGTFLFSIDSASLIYAMLVGTLIVTGFGVPIPEEIILVLGGYLAYLGILKLWPTMWVIFIGIIISDILGYWVGRQWGAWVHERLLSHGKFMGAIVKKAERYFDRYGEAVVFFSRVLSGIRTVVPLLAGHFRFDFKKFLVFDIAATAPWTVIVIGLSYFFGFGIDFLAKVTEVKHVIYAIIAVAIVGYFFVRSVRNHETKS